MTIIQMKYAILVSESKSMQEAARKAFISQPNLSEVVKALEEEIGIRIFFRSRTGVTLTSEGREFIKYAKQVIDQYELLESKYIKKQSNKKEFHVSTQHYTFAVNAFIRTIHKHGDGMYRFSIIETQTRNVIENVKNWKSDVGIIGVNSFNKKILMKLIQESNLVFHELMQRENCVYLWKNHPLAERKILTFADLEEYPCLIFEQEDNASFYFTEEAFGTYQYPKLIVSNDRATSMECMVGVNGYAIGTGLLQDSINAKDYVSVPLEEKEIMVIGYVVRKAVNLSEIAMSYINELKAQQDPQVGLEYNLEEGR